MTLRFLLPFFFVSIGVFCFSGCVVEELPNCGNGILDGNEECDDGNLENGDGCNSHCVLETALGDSDAAGQDGDTVQDDPAVTDAVGDDVADTASADKDTTVDMDDDETPDTAVDTETMPDQDIPCGNGTVDTGELCDGNQTFCSELTDGEKIGVADCNEYCNGWDTSTCTDGPQVATMEAIAYSASYIYPDIAGVEANQTPATYGTAAFRATVTINSSTYYIPHNQADNHLIPAIVADNMVLVLQNSYAGNSFTLPYVMLGMAQSSVTTGASLEAGISSSYEANFLVFDNTVDPANSDYDCVILVGFGMLDISQANLTLGSTGRLSFTSDNMRLYLPSQTPDGDMQSEITASGFAICQ